jgi:hypothetical protein
VTRTVVDRAGNVGSVTVGGIGIDQELPAITAVTVTDGAVFNEIQPAHSCTAEDSVSGVGHLLGR